MVLVHLDTFLVISNNNSLIVSKIVNAFKRLLSQGIRIYCFSVETVLKLLLMSTFPST